MFSVPGPSASAKSTSLAKAGERHSLLLDAPVVPSASAPPIGYSDNEAPVIKQRTQSGKHITDYELTVFFTVDNEAEELSVRQNEYGVIAMGPCTVTYRQLWESLRQVVQLENAKTADEVVSMRYELGWVKDREGLVVPLEEEVGQASRFRISYRQRIAVKGGCCNLL
eukprot:m51a1_g5202 hypothetical protein (168) ;mRNA; r:214885-215551